MKLASFIMIGAIVGSAVLSVHAGMFVQNDDSFVGQQSLILLADDDDRKERRDERGREDERKDKRDCRQEEGRVGKDKRDCKQEEVRDGVKGNQGAA